jgi:hypothetical protein
VKTRSFLLPRPLAGGCSPAPPAEAAAARRPGPPSPPRPPCHLPGADRLAALRRLQVPLDHAKPAAGGLKMHVTVAPAHREGTRTDPLFVLAGGPARPAAT